MSYVKQEPTGSFSYTRSYETDLDQQRNTKLAPMAQRFRSFSIGEMDASGNRTNREHFHQDDSYKPISSGRRLDAGPHGFLDTGVIDKKEIMRTVVASPSEFPKLGK